MTTMADNSCISETLQTQDGQSPWALYLPEDILLKILKLAIDCNNGPLPLLSRTAQVCGYWRDISYHPNLWKEVDLSSGWILKRPYGITEICESRLGDYTVSLNLEAWFRLKDEDLNVIDECCPNLKSLNLSSCENLTGHSLHILADSFPCLECIELSNVAPIMIGVKDLGYFLQQKGKRLKKLVLSKNDVSKGFGKNMADIYNVCPVLEHLDLSFLHVTGQDLRLDVSALQRGCPRMKVLNLEGTSVWCTMFQDNSHGFKYLEKFAVPSESVVGENPSCVSKVLRSSYNLKKLKFYASKGAVDLYEVPCSELEYLKLPITLMNCHVISQIRWQSSLKVLDLDWITGIKRRDIDGSLIRLFSQEVKFEKLEKIYLCGTMLSWHGVSAIVGNCSNLQVLNCTFCQNIPKFWAREIKGEVLRLLYKLINEGMSVEEFKSSTIETSYSDE